MVLEAFAGRVVCPETFVLGIVVMVHGPSLPSVALYAEVVVAFPCQLAQPCSALEESLCQGDACRYAVFEHLLYGKVLILVDVVLVVLVPPHLSEDGDRVGESCQKEYKVLFVHCFLLYLFFRIPMLAIFRIGFYYSQVSYKFLLMQKWPRRWVMPRELRERTMYMPCGIRPTSMVSA